MGLLTQFSWWYLPGCLLLGILFAWFQYRNAQNDGLKRIQVIGLAVLRTLAVALVALLLLNPYLRTDKKIIEKPLLLLAYDNSSSLVTADSSRLVNDMQAFQKELASSLADEVELRTFSFGGELNDSLAFNFNEKATDYSRLFETLSQRFSGKNLAGIVVATDGIQNRGYDPLGLIEKLGAPVYVWPLGDTTQKRDLRIREVRTNQRVFINNDFSVQVDLEVSKLAGREALVQLEAVSNKGVETIATQRIAITRDRFYTTLSMVAAAGQQAGLKKFRLKASVPDEENNAAANNRREFYVEVIDLRTKVLLLAHGPHPDLTVIRQALDNNPQYEVELHFAYQAVQLKGNYDLAILHQLPSAAPYSAAWMAQLSKLNLPSWFIVGSQTQLPSLQQAQKTVQLVQKAGSSNKALPSFQSDFSLFQTEINWQQALSNMPPMDVPFGDYQLQPQASALLKQRIGQITTQMPLLAYNPNQTSREAVLLGEGLWRWKLAAAEQRSDIDVSGELVRRTLQFLAVTDTKDPFVVRSNKKLYQEQDDIYFDATLLNESREPINSPEVRLQITNDQQQRFGFAMGRSGNNYLLNAGALPPGNYRWEAKVELAGKTYSRQGAFAVNALDLEQSNRVANHQLLERWSAISGGRLLNAEKPAESLMPVLQKSNATTPTSYYESRLEELISLEWMLVLIALLLSIEWVLRRYWGLR